MTWMRWVLLGILALAAGLRFYRLDQVPAGYTWDEASQIYNAWSIALWHRDENAQLLPLAFESFGDYKPPLLIYLLAGLYYFFGLHEVYIRYISAGLGVGVVYLTYLISQEFYKDKKLALLAAALMAILPWTINFSRIGFEQQLAFFFTTLGVYGLLKSKIWLAFISFGLSIYAFHTAKIFAPLIMGVWIIDKLKKHSKDWMVPFCVFILLILPQVYETITGMAGTRATTLLIYGKSGELLDILTIGKRLLTNILAYINPAFWVSGYDAVSIRNGVPGHGVLYWTVFMLFCFGLFFTLKNRQKKDRLLLGWLMLGLLPSVLTWPAPHALRSLFAALPVVLLSVKGLRVVVRYRYIQIIIGILLALEFGFYLNTYYSSYAQASAKDFQFGYKEALAFAAQIPSEKKVITDTYGQPYIYVLLFSRIHPQQFQYGALNSYEFRTIDWPEGKSHYLYLASPEEISPLDPAVIKTITAPGSSEVIWVIAKT